MVLAAIHDTLLFLVQIVGYGDNLLIYKLTFFSSPPMLMCDLFVTLQIQAPFQYTKGYIFPLHLSTICSE